MPSFSIYNTKHKHYYIIGRGLTRVRRNATKYFTEEDANAVILFRGLEDSEVVPGDEIQWPLPHPTKPGWLMGVFGDEMELV
jgi:hypothetical protein